MNYWNRMTWIIGTEWHELLEQNDMDYWDRMTWIIGTEWHGLLEQNDMNYWNRMTWIIGTEWHELLEQNDMNYWDRIVKVQVKISVWFIWRVSIINSGFVSALFGSVVKICIITFYKGPEWTSLLFAYPSALNNGAPIGYTHSILVVTDQVSPYEDIWRYLISDT